MRKFSFAAVIIIMIFIFSGTAFAAGDYIDISFSSPSIDKGSALLDLEKCCESWSSEYIGKLKALIGTDVGNGDSALTEAQLAKVREKYTVDKYYLPRNVTFNQAVLYISETEFKVEKAGKLSDVYYKGVIPYYTRVGKSTASDSALSLGLVFGTDYGSSEKFDSIAAKIAAATSNSEYAKSNYNKGKFGSDFIITLPDATAGAVGFKSGISADGANVTVTVDSSDPALNATFTKSGTTYTFSLPPKTGSVTYKITATATKSGSSTAKAMSITVNTATASEGTVAEAPVVSGETSADGEESVKRTSALAIALSVIYSGGIAAGAVYIYIRIHRQRAAAEAKRMRRRPPPGSERDGVDRN